MDVLLKVLDVGGQSANECLVDETEICEEVVADDNMGFLIKRFDDLLELFLDGGQLLFRFLAVLIAEPFGLDAREVAAC